MPSKVIGQDDSKEKQLSNQWAAIKTNYPLAYNDLMEFCATNKEMLVNDASSLSITLNGKPITITGELSNFLLQRGAGIDIVKTYIRLYSE